MSRPLQPWSCKGRSRGLCATRGNHGDAASWRLQLCPRTAPWGGLWITCCPVRAHPSVHARWMAAGLSWRHTPADVTRTGCIKWRGGTSDPQVLWGTEVPRIPLNTGLLPLQGWTNSKYFPFQVCCFVACFDCLRWLLSSLDAVYLCMNGGTYHAYVCRTGTINISLWAHGIQSGLFRHNRHVIPNLTNLNAQ